MSEQELNIGISEKESIREVLEAVPVTIEEIKIDSPTMKDGKEMKKKLVFMCKHPAKEEHIEISKVKYERDGKLNITGTWLSTDEEGLLIKNSASALLLAKYGAKTVGEMKGKTIETVQDLNQFLVFKGY